MRHDQLKWCIYGMRARVYVRNSNLKFWIAIDIRSVLTYAALGSIYLNKFLDVAIDVAIDRCTCRS